MTYVLIEPPFLDFRERTKSELGSYRAWFIASIPERVRELAAVVKESDGFSDWEPDRTVGSLETLGQWLETQVQVQPRSQDKIQQSLARLAFPVEVPQQALSDRSASLAFDVAMYFAVVVLSNIPGTRWDMLVKSKRLADYGQPVIGGFGQAVLNPVRTILTTAYGVARGEPARLGDLFRTWLEIKR
jgi:hypothetical protein